MIDWDLVPRIAFKLLDYKDKLPSTVFDDITLAYMLRNDIQLLECLIRAVSVLVKQNVDDRELYSLVERAVKLE
jgi:hypothetical protein